VTNEETKERFLPCVIETSVGVDRTALALLANAYEEEKLPDGETRTLLRLPFAVAPVKVAVLPLAKKIGEPAQRIATALRRHWNVFYDESGNIGRRYRRQDEIGTPFCVTYDFESESDAKVTVRERDSMTQERVAVDGLRGYLQDRLEAAR
jgi:glycyl-tRNA synthetase